MATSDAGARGRAAFGRNAWADAYALLSEADRVAGLGPEDLERLARAGYLIGEADGSADAWMRAHTAWLERGAVEQAVRSAFWLAFGLLNGGEHARAGGWIARAQRLLDESGLDCVERGYLLLPGALQAVAQGDVAGAEEGLRQVAEVAHRFADPDLAALARHSRGRVLIRRGAVREGVTLLDEAMAAVEAGDLSPAVVGVVYCSVIEGCLEIFDVRRAGEWTAALARWCASQPDLVAYRGECQVRRAEILRLHGAWSEAAAAAEAACGRLTDGTGRTVVGAAFYQKAELLRLRGAFDEAETAYREAHHRGRKPQPGLALLWLARGRVESAATAIRRSVEEAGTAPARTRLLAAHVEILLAADEIPTARRSAQELADRAEALDVPLLTAEAAGARGAVALAVGDAATALTALRRAWAAWEDIDASYDAARTRVLIGRACRALGDADTAALEFDAARRVFAELGAHPALDHLDTLRRPAPTGTEELTPRQTEVLRLVASGMTNREIAETLFISEKTVARHLSDIFLRLDLPNRAAATAYAYEQGLVGR